MKNDVIFAETSIGITRSISSRIWCAWYTIRAYFHRTEEWSKREKEYLSKKQRENETL